MALGPAKLLKYLIPTVCIFYSLSWSSLPPIRTYHEVFGNSDLYLDLYFETNPQGIFSRNVVSQSITFHGFMVSPDSERRVSGLLVKQNGQKKYFFDSDLGSFRGVLLQVMNQCEPSLYFHIWKGDRSVKSGKLKGGFCY